MLAAGAKIESASPVVAASTAGLFSQACVAQVIFLLDLREGRNGVRHRLNRAGRQPGQMRKPLAQYIDGRLRLRHAAAAPRPWPAAPGCPRVHCPRPAECAGCTMSSACSALRLCSCCRCPSKASHLQVRHSKHGVLNHLIALVFGLHVAGFPVGLRGAHKLPQSGIDQRRLRVDIDDGRRRAFQTERVSPGFSQPGAHNQLRQIGIRALQVRSAGVLLVGSGNGGRGAVAQGQLDRALQRQEARQEARGAEDQKQECTRHSKKRKQVSSLHLSKVG